MLCWAATGWQTKIASAVDVKTANLAKLSSLLLRFVTVLQHTGAVKLAMLRIGFLLNPQTLPTHLVTSIILIALMTYTTAAAAIAGTGQE
jgi:hypothetical protein